MSLLGWTRGAIRVLERRRMLDLAEADFTRADGLARTMTLILTSDWANVVALTDDDQLVLVRQYRPGVGVETLETAGGVIDEGEEPAVAAARELVEETGYVPRELVSLGSAFANPALQNNRIHYFLALGASRERPPAFDEGGEECEVVLVPRADLEHLFEKTIFSHALCWAALARANAYLGRLPAPAAAAPAPAVPPPAAPAAPTATSCHGDLV